MTVYGSFPSAAAILLKLLLAWKTSPVCRKTNSSSHPPSSIPSGRVWPPCCQRTSVLCSQSVPFLLQITGINHKPEGADVFPKTSYLFISCCETVFRLFLRLSLISAIKPQAQRWCFSFFPLCFIHMPSLNENSIVQEIYVMLTSHLVW